MSTYSCRVSEGSFWTVVTIAMASAVERRFIKQNSFLRIYDLKLLVMASSSILVIANHRARYYLHGLLKILIFLLREKTCCSMQSLILWSAHHQHRDVNIGLFQWCFEELQISACINGNLWLKSVMDSCSFPWTSHSSRRTCVLWVSMVLE